MKKSTRLKPLGNSENCLQRVFYCPACSTWRTKQLFQIQTKQLFGKTIVRQASSTSSKTAVNATKNIPIPYKPLYQALEDVKRKAAAHINLSRLQLAIQGLESESPVTRVAVLGLNVQETARRLIRLLLSDALGKESKWERDLTTKEEDYTQGLLLRYGNAPNPNIPQPANHIPTLYLPSSVLERNNIEILVSAVSELQIGEQLQSSQTTPADAILSPTIGTPANAYGRYTLISQPVHGCLITGSGLDDLVKIAELLASMRFSSPQDRQSVNIAINLPENTSTVGGQVFTFDASKAEEGLAAVRKSLGDATVYEHKWVDSGMPLISKWLTLSSAAKSLEKPPFLVQNLIASLLITAKANLHSQALLSSQRSNSLLLNPASRAQLDSAIEEFSRNAHLELQSGLASAWSSRNWRKLSWYKLFWRVDDVELIITDLVSNAWLPNTERAVYELSGRLSQAGISPMDTPTEPSLEIPQTATHTALQPEPTILQTQFTTGHPPTTEPLIVNPSGTANIAITPSSTALPLSLSISSIRNTSMARATTELTSLAQQIVLRTLSITGLSAGLSALSYVSLTPGNLYESGTVVALGSAFALWRMQRSWQTATKALEDGLYNEGRTTIRRVVERMRGLVEWSAQAKEDDVEVKVRREAQDAVERAQEELDKLVEQKLKK